jgi:serine/threonine protein kinase
VQSLPADERSDLYSVGVSLYQMVTGQRMFRATSGYSIMEAHVKETPRPPIEIQPTLPKAVSDLIMMSVAKNPAERFQSADAFRNALAQARAPLPQPAAQATTTTMVGLPLPPSAAIPSSRPATPPPAEDVRATPSPGVAQPSRVIAGRGLLLAVAAVILFVVLAGAWIYKSRQQPAMGSSPAGTSAQSSSTSSASPPQASAPVPQQPPPGAVPPNAVSPPTAAAPETAPRNSANRRSTTNASPNLAPGGAAADSQAQDQAAVALAQKKLLDELEKESDQLDSRAAAAEASVNTLEQQMHASGYGLRGDIVAARANMRNDLAKAKQAMDSADTDRARHFLDMAHREVEKLEDFLGRR